MEPIDVERALKLPHLVKTGNFKFRRKYEGKNNGEIRGNIRFEKLWM